MNYTYLLHPEKIFFFFFTGLWQKFEYSPVYCFHKIAWIAKFGCVLKLRRNTLRTKKNHRTVNRFLKGATKVWTCYQLLFPFNISRSIAKHGQGTKLLWIAFHIKHSYCIVHGFLQGCIKSWNRAWPKNSRIDRKFGHDF